MYSAHGRDVEDPKSGVEDLVFSIKENPMPNPKERGYLMRIILYEAIELPEIDDEV